MRDTGSNSWTFRAQGKNQERLAFADEAGLNVSELINESLAECLKKKLEAKTRQVREVLSAPVP